MHRIVIQSQELKKEKEEVSTVSFGNFLVVASFFLLHFWCWWKCSISYTYLDWIVIYYILFLFCLVKQFVGIFFLLTEYFQTTECGAHALLKYRNVTHKIQGRNEIGINVDMNCRRSSCKLLCYCYWLDFTSDDFYLFSVFLMFCFVFIWVNVCSTVEFVKYVYEYHLARVFMISSSFVAFFFCCFLFFIVVHLICLQF